MTHRWWTSGRRRGRTTALVVALGSGLFCAGPARATSAPRTCNVASTPLAGGTPADGNADGDFCDPEDGPFPEGQPLGNLPQAFGTTLRTCDEAPDPAPGNGVYHVVVDPVGGDDCA